MPTRPQRSPPPPVNGQEAFVLKGERVGQRVLVKATNSADGRRNGGHKKQQWLCQLINKDGVLGEQFWLEAHDLMALPAPTEKLAATSCKPTTTSVITHARPVRVSGWLGSPLRLAQEVGVCAQSVF